jgi:hypothetical protein
MGSRGYVVYCVLVLLLGLFVLGGIPVTAIAQDDSTCVNCHTSVRDLVKITRELAAQRGPAVSAETAGEG